MYGERTTEDLFREYRKTESLEIRNELVERNLNLAEYLARKYSGRGVEREDLVQVASYGLVLAVSRFDPEKGVQFATFATPTIIGEIKKHFRDTMWSLKVPRRLKDISMRIVEAKETMLDTLGRVPTVGELAAILEISAEDVLEALECGQAYMAYSLDNEPIEYEEGDTSQYEKFLGNDEEGYERFENAGVLEMVISEITPREKEIVQKRFVQEITQQAVAKDLGISQMTVSRIEKAMKEKFRTEYNK